MSGSGASNLGYSSHIPFSNVNNTFVNKYNTNDPAGFTDKTIPGLPGLSGAKINIDAAAGIVPGISLFKGGSKYIKRKIKNINTRYKKMKAGKRKTFRNKIKRIFKSHKKSIGGNNKKSYRYYRKSFRGGYSQYQNNQPMTPTYSVGGILPAKDLGLANPPPIKVLSNCTNCVDNYDHYTNKGFSSRGH